MHVRKVLFGLHRPIRLLLKALPLDLEEEITLYSKSASKTLLINAISYILINRMVCDSLDDVSSDLSASIRKRSTQNTNSSSAISSSSSSSSSSDETIRDFPLPSAAGCVPDLPLLSASGV
jgi:hypothetical protein